MRRSGRWWAAALAALAAAGGCRDGDGAAAGAPPAIEPLERRVELRLYVAREWSWNDEDTLRVEVVNGTAEPVEGTLHLSVATPAELAGTPPGAETASTAGGARVSLPLRLEAGATAALRQAVRTPPAPAAAGGAAAPDTAPRVPVRAWLSAPDGGELAAREDTLRIRPGSAVVEGGCGTVREASVTRYGIGPVRLEMRASELRALCPEARDTVLAGGRGAGEPALAVRVAGAPVLAVLAGDRVVRVVVDSAGLATPAGVGVGATLAELRTRYGRACAGAAEGHLLVWFPAAPGVSFALDTAAARPSAPPSDPAALAGDLRVVRLRVHAGPEDCPRPAREPPQPQEDAP